MMPGTINVEVGQVVDITDVIGQVGNSGRSTGPHLHLELKNSDYVSFDPMLWLQSREMNLEPADPRTTKGPANSAGPSSVRAARRS